MSKKVFCDFCGGEIAAARSGKTWYTITWHGSVTEMQRDICNECFDERLVAIKDDKPIIEPNADFICEKLAEWFDAPCNWTLGGIDMNEYMLAKSPDMCENKCPILNNNEKDGYANCWRKLMEVMANGNNNN